VLPQALLLQQDPAVEATSVYKVLPQLIQQEVQMQIFVESGTIAQQELLSKFLVIQDHIVLQLA